MQVNCRETLPGASIPFVLLSWVVLWALLRLSETKKAEYQEMAQRQKEEPLDCKIAKHHGTTELLRNAAKETLGH